LLAGRHEAHGEELRWRELILLQREIHLMSAVLLTATSKHDKVLFGVKRTLPNQQ